MHREGVVLNADQGVAKNAEWGSLSMPVSMSSSVLAPAEIEYPSADGKPVAESDFQLNSLTYARERLRIYFRDECKRNDVYVAGNLLIYYQEGNSGASVAPDVFAVIGVPNRDRSWYLLWQERKAPDFVLEITSRTTRGRGPGAQARAVSRVRRKGVLAVRPDRRLSGAAVAGQGVDRRRVPGREPADGVLALESRVLGVELHVTANGLRSDMANSSSSRRR